MQNFFLKSLLVVSSLFFIFMAQAVSKKPWTFLVYFAAANDLNQCAVLDLQEMMQAGSNENINIIAYVTLHEDGEQKQTKKLYIKKGSFIQIGETMVRDSGDMATLVEALQWASIDYPSDHIAVVLWGHGSGALNRSKGILTCKGICYDFDTDCYLTDRDCLQAFSWGRDSLRGGKKYDIIAIDACLLASIEMAYTLSSCADYMVAAEGTIPGDGYRYAYILNQCATQIFDSLFLAKSMVGPYDQENVDTCDYTLSVIDLNACNQLVDYCNGIAQVLTSQLKGKDCIMVKATIKKCIDLNNCTSFDQGVYIDMCQFYKNLLKNIAGLKLPKSIATQFQQLLTNGMNMFSTVIKANVASKNYQHVGGLSIYFSRYAIDFSYYGLYWTERNPHWLNFLEAYFDVKKA